MKMQRDDPVQVRRQKIAKGTPLSIRDDNIGETDDRVRPADNPSLRTRWRKVFTRREPWAFEDSPADAATTSVPSAGRTEHGSGSASTRTPSAAPAAIERLHHRCCLLHPLVLIMIFSGAVGALALLVLVVPAHSQRSRVEIPAPDPSGMPWKVAYSHSFLVDPSRWDPYKDSENRKVAYSIFMPVFNEACGEMTDNNYMPALTAQASNLQFFGDKSAGVFDQLHFESCSKNTDEYNANHFPLLIFEPAVGTSRFVYNQLARQLSANGAHVVTIDHPYDAPIVEFAGLDPIQNDGAVTLDAFQVNRPVNNTEIKKAIDTRIADINSVIEELEKADTLPRLFPNFTFTDGNTKVPTQHLFVLGHGLGGSVATSMGFNDKRVLWTINLSGSTPVIREDVLAYTIFFGRKDYGSENDTAWQETKKHIAGPQVEWTYDQADQFDFSDLPLVSHLIDPDNKAKGLGTPYEKMDPNDPTATFRALSCFLEAYFRDTVIPGWSVDPRLPGESHNALQKCLGWFGGAMKPHIAYTSRA